jgi:putative transcriptional regulator
MGLDAVGCENPIVEVVIVTEAVVQVNFRRLLAEKEVRENTRYSMTDVARETGMSRQAIYAWLNGDIRTVRLDTLAALCRFLECQPGDLLAFGTLNGRHEKEGVPT